MINLGTGVEISVGELAGLIFRLLDRELPVEFSPDRARPQGSEVERLLADVSKAEELMGWKSEVALEDGLRRTIEWFGDAVVRYKPSLYNV